MGSALLAAALALMGGSTALPPAAPPLAEENSEQRAAELARHGDHAQAAALYESLAGNRAPPARADYQLHAVSEWLAADRPMQAQQLLARMEAPLTSAQSYERALLEAETALLGDRVQEAWQKISALAASAVSATALRYDSLKMRIALAAGRPIDGIRAELDAERYASSPADRTALHAQLLAGLRSAREHGVVLNPRSSNDPIVRGWLELGATAAHGPALANVALAAHWRSSYPNHPALDVIGQAFPSPLINLAPGGRVALLLPLTGPAAAQAAAVREGFLSALYELPATSRPALHL